MMKLGGLEFLLWISASLCGTLLIPHFGLAEEGDAGICQIISPQSLKSQQNSAESLEVTISNAGEEKMDIYWIDYTGEEIYIDSLDQGDSSTFATFAGHVWRAKFHTSGRTNFERVLLAGDRNKVLIVGSSCKPLDFGLNFTEYLFKTTSDIEMIPNPPLVLQQISQSPCHSIGLTNWINKYVSAPGYHVLCLTRHPTNEAAVNGPWKISIEGWRNGYLAINQDSGQTFTGSSFSDLRRHIESLLPVSKVHTDRFLELTQSEILKQQTIIHSSRGENNWEFLPQRWALFSTDRKRVQGLQDLSPLFDKPSRSLLSSFFPRPISVLALVMEGGQFVYPGIDLGFTRKIETHDRQIQLETISMRPLILRMADFLSSGEIQHIIKQSAPQIKPSPVSLMDKDVGKSAAEFRTSQQVFLHSQGSSLLLNLEARVSELTGCPLNQQETLQVLRYEKGQYYLPHQDYWDPVYYQSSSEVKRSHAGHKNRMSTVFWYLSDSDGGHTAFPLAPTQRRHVSQILPEPNSGPDRAYYTPGSPENHLSHTQSCHYGLRVPPQVGTAILFYSLLPNGLGDHFSQHAACAVNDGVKWAANKWVWNKPL